MDSLIAATARAPIDRALWAPVDRCSIRISCMLEMLRDLMHHKGHANAALLNAIRQNAAAVSEPELWCTRLNIVMVQLPFLLRLVRRVHPAPTPRASSRRGAMVFF